MAIFLDGQELPADLQWIDEFDYSPVAQTLDHSIGGALMVQEGAKLAGRPVTLSGGDWAWVTRATVKNLFGILLPGHIMVLDLEDGRTLAVMWRFADTPIKSTPVIFQAPADDADGYYIELRLVEV